MRVRPSAHWQAETTRDFATVAEPPPAKQTNPWSGSRALPSDSREPCQERGQVLHAAANLLSLLRFKRPNLRANGCESPEFTFDFGARGRQQMRGLESPPARPHTATDGLGPKLTQYQQ